MFLANQIAAGAAHEYFTCSKVLFGAHHKTRKTVQRLGGRKKLFMSNRWVCKQKKIVRSLPVCVCVCA